MIDRRSPQWRDHLARIRDRARIASGRATFKPARAGVDPLIAQTVKLLGEHAGYIGDIGRRAGVHRQTLRKWGQGIRSPGVLQLQAVLQVLGYELKIVRRREEP